MNYEDGYEEWPDLFTPKNTERLLERFPMSRLVQLHALPQGSTERVASWEALGVTDPAKQQALEVELDNLINALAKKYQDAPLIEPLQQAPKLDDFFNPMNWNFIE